jgi:tetratricopeptide (TPR) repeat protein
VLRAQGCNQLAWLASLAQENTYAAIWAEEGVRLFRAAGDRGGLANCLLALAHTAMHQGNYREATTIIEESLQLWREVYGDAEVAFPLDFLCGVALHQGDYDRAVAFGKESIALTRAQPHQGLLKFTLDTCACALFSRGDLEEALALWVEGVGLAYASQDRRATVYYLEGFAGVAARQGLPQRAARLAGAASAVREEIHTSRSVPEAAIVERFLAPARAQLDEAEWNKAWNEGWVMTLEQAIAYGLDASGT